MGYKKILLVCFAISLAQHFASALPVEEINERLMNSSPRMSEKLEARLREHLRERLSEMHATRHTDRLEHRAIQDCSADLSDMESQLSALAETYVQGETSLVNVYTQSLQCFASGVLLPSTVQTCLQNVVTEVQTSLQDMESQIVQVLTSLELDYTKLFTCALTSSPSS